MMGDVKESRAPSRTTQIVYSATGDLITKVTGFRDDNPAPDASAPSVPMGTSRRVLFDITQR
jgi:hypothetical protein